MAIALIFPASPRSTRSKAIDSQEASELSRVLSFGGEQPQKTGQKKITLYKRRYGMDTQKRKKKNNNKSFFRRLSEFCSRIFLIPTIMLQNRRHSVKISIRMTQRTLLQLRVLCCLHVFLAWYVPDNIFQMNWKHLPKGAQLQLRAGAANWNLWRHANLTQEDDAK